MQGRVASEDDKTLAGYFKKAIALAEISRLAFMQYMRFALSLRNAEDPLPAQAAGWRPSGEELA